MSAARKKAPSRAGIPVREITSPGGLTIWLVEDHTLPLVSLRFAFRAGSVQDPHGKPGIAHMVASLLEEGAGPLNSQAFNERLQDSAIDLSFNCQLEYFGGSLRCLTRHLDEAGALLSLALVEPRFDADAIERVRAQVIAGLRRELSDPDTIATRSFWETAYPGHAYARPVGGTLETVPTITRDDIVAFHKVTYARDNLLLVAVGDIDEARLCHFADKTFGGLPARARLAEIPRIDMVAPGTRKIVEQDIPQSVVRFGRTGVPRKDKDFITAFLVMHIYGGFIMQSRLFTEVREKRGLAYSAYCSLQTLRKTANFIGWTSTKNERVAESLEVIHAQALDLAENGPTAEEIDKAKKYLIGSYPLRFDSSGKIANELMGLRLEDLGTDYVAKRSQMIEAVTKADAKRVARRLFGDGKLVVAVVGKPQGLQPA